MTIPCDDHRADGPDPLPDCHCAEMDRLVERMASGERRPLTRRYVAHEIPCDMCGIAGGTWLQFAPDGSPGGCVERHDRNTCAHTLRAEVLRLRLLVERYESIESALAAATETR